MTKKTAANTGLAPFGHIAPQEKFNLF